MKKFSKAMLGVTLLEVMLVLAIAAMIIVMSVRYYQSASSSQQSNSLLEQVQGIVSAANSMAQAKGAYNASGVTITNSGLAPLLPGGSLNTPWGTAFTISATGPTTFSIDIPGVPSGVCPLFKSKLLADNHFGIAAGCEATAATDLLVVYTSNP